MAENEHFLARWARLKQETAKRSGEPDRLPGTTEEGTAAAESRDKQAPDAASPVSEPGPSESFDPASLPALETIDAASEVSAFLARGVPAELTRAALRRAWAADPAIRDFVGLSENAWDFTAPDGVPGFGPLQPTDDVGRMLAQLGGQGPGDVPAPERAGAAGTPTPERAVPESQAVSGTGDAAALGGETPQEIAHEVVNAREPAAPAQPFPPARQSEEIANENEDVAAQNASKPSEFEAPPRPRAHGGALPE